MFVEDVLNSSKKYVCIDVDIVAIVRVWSQCIIQQYATLPEGTHRHPSRRLLRTDDELAPTDLVRSEPIQTFLHAV